MGGYIRMDKDLEDDPRVADLADLLAALDGTSLARARNAVIGGLYRLWRYADTHLGRHNRLKTPLHGVARLEEVTALPAMLLEKFPREWLRVHADGSIELPDYSAKNNLIDRDIRREKNRERVRRFRERHRRNGSNGNALHGPPDEALQRYENVTTGPGPGPDPGPNPPNPGPGPEPQRAASPPPAAAGSAATPPEREPEGPLPDTELRRQVELLRALRWDDERILSKWARRGMTQAHLRGQP